MCALLTCKINIGVPCHKMNVSEKLIRNAMAAASKRKHDLRVAREESTAARAACGSDTDEEVVWLSTVMFW